MDVICSRKDHPDCGPDGCEHSSQHEKFYECTDGECNLVSDAACISTEEMKKKRVAELEKELAEARQDLLDFLKGLENKEEENGE